MFARAWRKLEKEVGHLTLDGPAEQWHEARITAKRARYAAEALTPVFGPAAKGLATALAEVTEQLGEHQDAYIAQETCRELAAQFDGATGFALGRLHGYEVQCELIARVRLQEAWPMVRGLAKRTKLR
jgi:CHAD domain-containing protein